MVYIHFGPIGLGPDEAQYWTWSQQLDWGYYSKPPGIAWQIWLGTKFFGNTELGVRFLSVILSIFLSLSTYWLAIACGLMPLTAFWSGLAMALVPVGMISSLFAITDVGMALFWTLACIVVVSSIRRQDSPNYYLLGLLIALGSLFKWPAYLFWAVIIVSAIFYRFLISKHIVGGIIISLLGLLPSLYWNINHNWVTFRHVGATIISNEQSTAGGNFFDFLGAQAILLSPILFILFLLAAAVLIFKRDKTIPNTVIFCGLSSFIILLGYCIAAIFKKMQGNWCDFIYPSAIVALSWYASEYIRKQGWLVGGIFLGLILSLFALKIPTIQSHGYFSNYQIPYKWNPFRQNVGWGALSKILLESGYNQKEEFLFGDKYQTSSILSFYGPEQKRAYFLNLHKIRLNQFSFWAGMAEEQKGQTGYFVLTENSPHLEKDLEERVAFYKGALSQYFKSVEYKGVHSLFDSYGKMAKGALIFRCEEYNGLEPIESKLY